MFKHDYIDWITLKLICVRLQEICLASTHQYDVLNIRQSQIRRNSLMTPSLGLMTPALGLLADQTLEPLPLVGLQTNNTQAKKKKYV